MRLTLRTLLAYLDDTIDSTEIKQIGQKVSESDAAQELITRIKQVTRRRRLTVPEVKGVDDPFEANKVAQYLDNELDSEQVAELEKICLESDVHLAEVAACHQILTLMLGGEQILIPPTAKQRMYNVIHGRKKAQSVKAKPVATSTRTKTKQTVSHVDEDDPMLLGLPQLSKAPWLRWALPLVAVVLLVIIGGVVWKVVSDGTTQVSSNGGSTVGTTQPITKDNDPLKTKVATRDQSTKEVTPPIHKATPPPKKEDVLPPKKEAIIPPKKEATPPPKETTPPPKKEDTPPPKKEDTPPPKKDDTPPKKDGTPPVKPVDPIPPAPKTPSMNEKAIARFISKGQVLLTQAPKSTEWIRARPNGQISSAHKLLSLPGFHSEILSDSGVEVLLWGNIPELVRWPLLESVVTFHENKHFDLELTLSRGRIYITNRKAKGPAKVRLRFFSTTKKADEIWDLTLDNPGDEVSIEKFHLYTSEINYREDEAPLTQVGCFFLNGTGSMEIGYRVYGNLTRGTTFLWDNKGGGLRGPISQLKDLPFWDKNRKDDPKVINDVRNGREEISNLLLKNNKPSVQLLEALEDKRPINRLIGLRSLGAIDAVSKLLEALAMENSDTKNNDRVRSQAIFVLRNWISRSVANGKKLYDAKKGEGLLLKKYTRAEAETIFDLLHSFSQKQRMEPETYSYLIENLRHKQLAVRELAIWHLTLMVPYAKIPYHPAGGEAQRELGYQAWKKFIPEGKLPPPPKEEPRRP